MEDASSTPSGQRATRRQSRARSASPGEALANPARLLEFYGLGERDFSKVRMAGVVLEGANLAQVRLEAADFCGAHMGRINLRQALLNHADFCGADLRGANLAGADLRGARFTGADLRGTNLSGADLRGAHLDRAHFSRTTRWPRGFDPIASGAVLV